jgi:hypothetical protein
MSMTFTRLAHGATAPARAPHARSGVRTEIRTLPGRVAAKRTASSSPGRHTGDGAVAGEACTGAGGGRTAPAASPARTARKRRNGLRRARGPTRAPPARGRRPGPGGHGARAATRPGRRESGLLGPPGPRGPGAARARWPGGRRWPPRACRPRRSRLCAGLGHRTRPGSTPSGGPADRQLPGEAPAGAAGAGEAVPRPAKEMKLVRPPQRWAASMGRRRRGGRRTRRR